MRRTAFLFPRIQPKSGDFLKLKVELGNLSELSAVTHEPYVALYSMYRCVTYLPTVA